MVPSHKLAVSYTLMMAPPQPGNVIEGKYRVEHVLGEGSMGVVLAATHLDLDQLVAIKFLHPRVAERADAAARFLQEARAAVKIQSEHVARVFDVGKSQEGSPFMVMEYLEGSDLAALLGTQRDFAIGDAVTYIQQACEAIAEAHAAGIVHRDLKPANLFLTTRAEKDPIIKVLDFGISKAIASDPEVTQPGQTGLIMGSPVYMSPEQLRACTQVDERGDIWALGTILYEMIAGVAPFEAESLSDLCDMILGQPPKGPRNYRPDLAVELERVILRCLEKEPAGRYATVADLSLSLAPFARDSGEASAERCARALRRPSGGAAVSRPPPGSSVPPPSVTYTRTTRREAPLPSAPPPTVHNIADTETETVALRTSSRPRRLWVGAALAVLALCALALGQRGRREERPGPMGLSQSVVAAGPGLNLETPSSAPHTDLLATRQQKVAPGEPRDNPSPASLSTPPSARVEDLPRAAPLTPPHPRKQPSVSSSLSARGNPFPGVTAPASLAPPSKKSSEALPSTIPLDSSNFGGRK